MTLGGGVSPRRLMHASITTCFSILSCRSHVADWSKNPVGSLRLASSPIWLMQLLNSSGGSAGSARSGTALPLIMTSGLVGSGVDGDLLALAGVALSGAAVRWLTILVRIVHLELPRPLRRAAKLRVDTRTSSAACRRGLAEMTLDSRFKSASTTSRVTTPAVPVPLEFHLVYDPLHSRSALSDLLDSIQCVGVPDVAAQLCDTVVTRTLTCRK